ncbi:MAG: hypothetical protein U9R57_08105 [Thermodesulfobacteriota bacterium]|nr:hypothetical protein [Thermodesulfobacteriota bacterium]
MIHYKRFSLFLSCVALSLFLALQPQSCLADFEEPRTLQAASILEPSILKGKHHTVDSVVKNDGMFNHYSIISTFGDFKANSTTGLKTVIHEIGAIAAMKEVEVDDTALESLKQSGSKTVTGLKNLFTKPQETLEGAASGVSSLFHRAKETVGSRKTTGGEDSRVEQIIGLSKSKGLIASKFGVNMYSHNEALQEELDRLARADYVGGLGISVATSFVPVGGLILGTSNTARLLEEAINTTPASELWLRNKEKLLAMGMNEGMVELFLNNPSYSPALETFLVAALEKMDGVKEKDLFIMVALQANDHDMAKTITEIAVMSAGYHKHVAPLATFAPMARLTCGIKKDGSVVVLLPADHIIWSTKVAGVAGELTEKSGKGDGAGTELWVLGDFSKQAESELKNLGWQLHPKSYRKLVPKEREINNLNKN